MLAREYAAIHADKIMVAEKEERTSCRKSVFRGHNVTSGWSRTAQLGFSPIGKVSSPFVVIHEIESGSGEVCL